MKEMFYEAVNRRVILVHTNQQPSNEEWEVWVKFLETGVSNGNILGLFVLTETVGPNALQRKVLAEMWARVQMPPIAIVTPTTAVRAIVTALNFFFSRPQKTFHPAERRAAFEYVGLTDLELAEETLQRLMRLAGRAQLKAS